MRLWKDSQVCFFWFKDEKWIYAVMTSLNDENTSGNREASV